ncbi:type II secretion system protein M [Catenovulum sp. SM1970]|uniref:type II secretion system protein GspM n=1 Tax=Marinifaba aquimaris TaxID=2741323 RepID=UPI001573AD00|nr:type II secretion system protein M [Marinifaba aquimaris]NTS75844.1 type II secretion system protein M [Marinifaba aquimaris]
MEQLKAWYGSLAKREQQLVLAASVVLIIGLFFQLVIGPMNDGAAKAQADLDKKQKLLVWVTENAAKVKAADAAGKSNNSGSLSQIVNGTARSAGIKITGTRPQGTELQVQIDTVEFNALITWLELLTSKQGIRITTLDVNAGDAPGTVNVRRLQLAK